MSRRTYYGISLGLLLAILAGVAGYELVDTGAAPGGDQPAAPSSGDELVIVTWNVRGYPEKDAEGEDKDARRKWFSARLAELSPDVLCVQEIANQRKVDHFLATEEGYTSTAFLDSSDGQDNAIFAKGPVEMRDLSDPEGFQHPIQAAYVSAGGFDAVIVTVHLSWTDEEKREEEKTLLQGVVTTMLAEDNDVIIVGDFNTKEEGIQELADAIGMRVMVPQGQDGVGTTHAGNRYDHFLVSPDLASEEAVRCQIQVFGDEHTDLAEKVSDHVPVVAWFRRNKEFQDRD